VAAERRIQGGAVLQIQARGAARIRVPLAETPPRFDVIAEGPTPGSRGKLVPSRLENGAVAVEVTPEISGRWLYLVPR